MIRVIPHGPIFLPAAELLYYELGRLGHESAFISLNHQYETTVDARSEPKCLNIFVGPLYSSANPSHRCIWWNFELPKGRGIGLHPREHRPDTSFIWEYSKANLTGTENEAALQLGYSPAWIKPGWASLERPIDVLFTGAKSRRRWEVIEECKRLGLNVVWDAFWGEDFWKAMTEAKIVLNIHAYAEMPQFESLRCFPAIQAGACVLTECCSNMDEYPGAKWNCMNGVHIGELAGNCKRWIKEGWWKEDRDMQYNWLRHKLTPFRSNLKYALEKTSSFFVQQDAKKGVYR